MSLLFYFNDYVSLLFPSDDHVSLLFYFNGYVSLLFHSDDYVSLLFYFNDYVSLLFHSDAYVSLLFYFNDYVSLLFHSNGYVSLLLYSNKRHYYFTQMIICHYYFTSCEFFTPAFIGDLSLEFFGISVSLPTILLSLNNTVVWMVLILPLISNSSNLSSSPLVTVQVLQLQLVSLSSWCSKVFLVLCLGPIIC